MSSVNLTEGGAEVEDLKAAAKEAVRISLFLPQLIHRSNKAIHLSNVIVDKYIEIQTFCRNSVSSLCCKIAIQ